jgi:hypothetical protein
MLRAIVVLAAVCAVSAAIVAKDLAGPPVEFASHEIPSPVNVGVAADSALYFMEFQNSNSWSTPLSIDSTVQASLSIISPMLDSFQVSLVNAAGQAVPLQAVRVSFGAV